MAIEPEGCGFKNNTFKFVALKTNGIYDEISSIFSRSLKKVGLFDKLVLHEISNNEGIYGTQEFTEIAFRKLDLVKKTLNKGYDVLLSDVDIIFRKNPIPYLKRKIEISKLDLLIQDNSYYKLNHAGKKVIVKHLVNTGFLYVKANKRTSLLFDRIKSSDIEGMKKRYPKAIFEDQDLLDFRLKTQNKNFNIKYETLPMDLFPCGRSIYNDSISLTKAYILHFNWVPTPQKLTLMKKYVISE